MVTCGNCGVQNLDGARFCQWCGQDLPGSTVGAGRIPPTSPPAAGSAPGSFLPDEDGPTLPVPSAELVYPPYVDDGTLPPPAPTRPGYPLPTAAVTGYPSPYGGVPPTPPPGGILADAPRWFWPATVGLLALILMCTCALLALLLTRPGTQGPLLPLGGATATGFLPTAPPTLFAPTPFPSLTPRPTQTALPTLPPLPNTSTPVPTLPIFATLTPPSGVTPLPGPGQPTPGGTPAWMRYLTPECAAAIIRLQTASDGFTANPLVALDEAWRAELVEAGKDVRLECGSLEEASPVPGQMAEAQRNLALASAEFDQAARLLDEGVRPFNPGKLWQGLQGLGRAATYLNHALAALAGIGG